MIQKGLDDFETVIIERTFFGSSLYQSQTGRFPGFRTPPQNCYGGPFHSDRIAQVSHLIPYYPCLCKGRAPI